MCIQSADVEETNREGPCGGAEAGLRWAYMALADALLGAATANPPHRHSPSPRTMHGQCSVLYILGSPVINSTFDSGAAIHSFNCRNRFGLAFVGGGVPTRYEILLAFSKVYIQYSLFLAVVTWFPPFPFSSAVHSCFLTQRLGQVHSRITQVMHRLLVFT